MGNILATFYFNKLLLRSQAKFSLKLADQKAVAHLMSKENQVCN